MTTGGSHTDRARELRTLATDTEQLLWSHLRNRALGAKFRRQHPMCGYILDFYCEAAQLAIELDGGQHAEPEPAARDRARDATLESNGIRVIRFWDHELLGDLETVLRTIYDALGEHAGGPHPSPLPAGEGTAAARHEHDGDRGRDEAAPSGPLSLRERAGVRGEADGRRPSNQASGSPHPNPLPAGEGTAAPRYEHDGDRGRDEVAPSGPLSLRERAGVRGGGDHLGEVIASSTTRLTAQAPEAEAAPAFGAFVVVEAPAGRAVGVVSEVRAGSFDPNRRPTAYGLPAAELYAQQPQLRDLLVTEFDALLVGHEVEGRWLQLLPPHPPRLHAFVAAAPALAVRLVTADGGYLRTLLAAEATDDLLAAAVRSSLAAQPIEGADRDGFLIHTGRALARLLGDDYDRLQALLRRIAP